MIAAVLAGGFGHVVTDGSLLLALPVAVLAGLVSFASPCVLPLVPGYLGYLGAALGASSGRATAVGRGGPGAVGQGVRTRDDASRGRVLLGVMLFVAGFTVVFVAFGALAGTLGGTLARWVDPVSRVLGVVVVVMGLAFAGLVPALARERRPHLAPRAGAWGAALLGATFGLGWTPCIGPTLAAILTLSLDGGSAARGALLAVAFCVGLGVPFVLVALGLQRSARARNWLRRHRIAVMRVGGGLLVVLGLALVTGVWGMWAAWLQGLLTGGGAFVPAV